MSFLRIVALGIALSAAPLAATATADDQDMEQLLVEWATTPAQHQALAKHFKEKAEAAKAEAAHHRAMAKSYSSTKAANVKPQMDHCNKLAALADQEAAEYEKMAADQAAK
jgi:hypothetical protein